jgi:hypothetical protein
MLKLWIVGAFLLMPSMAAACCSVGCCDCSCVAAMSEKQLAALPQVLAKVEILLKEEGFDPATAELFLGGKATAELFLGGKAPVATPIQEACRPCCLGQEEKKPESKEADSKAATPKSCGICCNF